MAPKSASSSKGGKSSNSSKSAMSMGLSSTIIFVLILAIIVLVLFAIFNASTMYKKKESDERFSEKKLFHIVYAHQNNCPHCIKFNDTFDLVARAFAQNVTSHDTEVSKVERANLSDAQMKHIDGFPTVLVYMDGMYKTKAVGNMSSEDFGKFLQDAIKE